MLRFSAVEHFLGNINKRPTWVKLLLNAGVVSVAILFVHLLHKLSILMGAGLDEVSEEDLPKMFAIWLAAILWAGSLMIKGKTNHQLDRMASLVTFVAFFVIMPTVLWGHIVGAIGFILAVLRQSYAPHAQ